jgi:uncharacterized protein (DUF2267 family)
LPAVATSYGNSNTHTKNGAIMSLRSVDAIERTVHKTNEWLKELTEELAIEDREDAWRILKSYLQLLRDELTVDEGAQLAAQLPLILRGAFYEGFDPGRRPAKARDRESFLDLFASRARLRDRDEAARAAEAATRVLRRHVTEGELEDVLSQLPREVTQVLQHG